MKNLDQQKSVSGTPDDSRASRASRNPLRAFDEMWTPGPWANVRDDFIEADNGTVVVEQLNNEIGDLEDEEITGNGNLISAAPDLYAALDNAMHLLREVWGRNNPNHPIWKNGPAALAKARGITDNTASRRALSEESKQTGSPEV